MSHAEIGLIGLGVMGSNLALNIAEKGIRSRSTTAPHRERRSTCATPTARCAKTSCRARRWKDLVAAISPPRPIIIMRPARPVDEQIDLVLPLLSPGDIIIDAGNANFHDTVRRTSASRAPASTSSAWASRAARRARGTGPRSWSAARRASWHRVEADPRADCRPVPGRALRRLARHRRRRPFRQDHPQRHRICRHADDRRGLRPAARRRSACPPGDRPALRPTGTRGRSTPTSSRSPPPCCRRRSADRQADGRHDRRQRRAEGHRPLGRDRGADAGHRRDRHRGGGGARGLSSMNEEREAAERALARRCGRSRPRRPRRGAGRSRRGAVRRQDRRLCAGLRGDARGLAGVRLGPADGDRRRIWRAGCIIRSQFLDTIASAFDTGADLPNLLLSPAFVDGVEGRAVAAPRRGDCRRSTGSRCRPSRLFFIARAFTYCCPVPSKATKSRCPSPRGSMTPTIRLEWDSSRSCWFRLGMR